MLRIKTLLIIEVKLKPLIHPMEERKYQQSKEEALQESSSATTSMMNSRRCPRKNATSLLNGASPGIMLTRTINRTNETQTIKAIPIMKQQRK